MLAGQRKTVLPDFLIAQNRRGSGNDLQGVAHPADTGFTLFCHLASRRSNEPDAAFLQDGDVACRRSVVPHLWIHRWCDKDRFVRCQQHGCGKIVGNTVSRLGHQVCRCRRNQDKVMIPRQSDVADIVFGLPVEQASEDFLGGKRTHGKRSDELLSACGHDRDNTCTTFLEPPDEIKRLVGGNSAADDQHDLLAVEHGG